MLKSDTYEKIIFNNDVKMEYLTNIIELLIKIHDANEFDRFKFIRPIPANTKDVIGSLYAMLEICLKEEKQEILKTCKENQGFGDKQIFETLVTFFDDYYVNYVFVVKKCLQVIKKDNIPVTDILVDKLMEFSNAVETKGINSNFHNPNPVIVLKNNITSTPLMVVDGNHRVKRHYKAGKKIIKSYVLDKDYLAKISISEVVYRLIQLAIQLSDYMISYRIGDIELEEYNELVNYLDKMFA